MRELEVIGLSDGQKVSRKCIVVQRIDEDYYMILTPYGFRDVSTKHWFDTILSETWRDEIDTELRNYLLPAIKEYVQELVTEEQKLQSHYKELETINVYSHSH